MRKVLLISTIIVAFGVLLIVAKYGRSILWALTLGRQVAAHQAQLTAPASFQPAAVALAKLCQSSTTLQLPEDLTYRPAWLPAEVLRLQPTYVAVKPNGAYVAFGGGFHHYSYQLTLDEDTSEDGTNWWVLVFSDEYAGKKTLCNFSMKPSDGLTRQEFIEHTISEYHRRMSACAKDDDVRSRLTFLLRHADVEAAARSVNEFAARYPRDWLDQLLDFLIASRNDAGAADRLNAWAARENDFSSWLMAAYAHLAADDLESAESCVRRALESAPNDPRWIQWNARFRGAAMCSHLYNSRRYETCIALCDALLHYSGAGTHLESQLTTLREMAQNAAHTGSPPQATTLQLSNLFDPFEKIDLPALLKLAPASQPD